MPVKSQQQYYSDFVDEIQSEDPSLNDTNAGSDIDLIAGVVSTAANEISILTQEEFRKTFFDTANGPEITKGPDDLQTLAVDHFGEDFKRPLGVASIGSVRFSRPNDDAGNVEIPLGTVVKTQKTSGGNSISVVTTQAATLTGTEILVSSKAQVLGPQGNVNPNTLVVLESSLSDPSVVVTNPNAFVGGKNVETDPEYRETIRNLFESIKGGSLGAIKAAAKTVSGVFEVTASEFLMYVKEWDVGNDLPVGDYFAIPRVKLFVTDINGTADTALISAVRAAVGKVSAAGVYIDIVPASAVGIDWTINITLNPSGPNYAVLSNNPQMILDEMRTYLQGLPVGADFIRVVAKNYLMSKFGPGGTNDLTDLSTVVPTGDVSVNENEKVIPGNLVVGE